MRSEFNSESSLVARLLVDALRRKWLLWHYLFVIGALSGIMSATVRGGVLEFSVLGSMMYAFFFVAIPIFLVRDLTRRGSVVALRSTPIGIEVLARVFYVEFLPLPALLFCAGAVVCTQIGHPGSLMAVVSSGLLLLPVVIMSIAFLEVTLGLRIAKSIGRRAYTSHAVGFAGMALMFTPMLVCYPVMKGIASLSFPLSSTAVFLALLAICYCFARFVVTEISCARMLDAPALVASKPRIQALSWGDTVLAHPWGFAAVYSLMYAPMPLIIRELHFMTQLTSLAGIVMIQPWLGSLRAYRALPVSPAQATKTWVLFPFIASAPVALTFALVAASRGELAFDLLASRYLLAMGIALIGVALALRHHFITGVLFVALVGGFGAASGIASAGPVVVAIDQFGWLIGIALAVAGAIWIKRILEGGAVALVKPKDAYFGLQRSDI